MADTVTWPVKTGEVVHWIFDSTLWNGFSLRDDDIVIATYPKSGTHWMQQIVSQLVFAGSPEVFGDDHSPWIESRLRPNAVPMADAQDHRRFLKTHLPIGALHYSPKAKYLYGGRDPRDVFWSWYNHFADFTPGARALIGSLPSRNGQPVEPPNPDIRVAFNEWLDTNGAPNLPYWSHVAGWWEFRDLPNLRLFHFANFKADLAGEIRKIAEFLEIDIDEAKWPAILKHCGFDHMKQQAVQQERFRTMFVGGGGTMINKGTNGRWRDVLTVADQQKFQALAAANLPPDCAHWLATGELPR